MNRSVVVIIGCFGLLIVLFFSLALMAFAPSYFVGNNSKIGNSDAVSSFLGESCQVPEPYKAIFNDASSAQGAPASLITAIFARGEHRIFKASDWPDSNGPWARPSGSSAKGPFQFLDGTWQDYGTDGNQDGKKDVENLHDASYAASKYLAANIKSHKNRGTEGAIKAAILRYRGTDDQEYIDRVYDYYLELESCSNSVGFIANATECGKKIISQAEQYKNIPYDQEPFRCGPSTRGVAGVKYLDCSSYVGRVYYDLQLIKKADSRCFDTAGLVNHPDFIEITSVVKSGGESVRPGDIIRSGFKPGTNTKLTNQKGDPIGHVVIYVSGDPNGKMKVWQSGGDCGEKVCFGSRSSRPNQQYFRAKQCMTK